MRRRTAAARDRRESERFRHCPLRFESLLASYLLAGLKSFAHDRAGFGSVAALAAKTRLAMVVLHRSERFGRDAFRAQPQHQRAEHLRTFSVNSDSRIAWSLENRPADHRRRSENLRSFAEKSDRRFVNLLLNFRFLSLGNFLNVLDIGAAEFAAQLVDVKLDVILPRFLQRPQQKSSDRAALGAGESLLFPDFGEHRIRRLGLAAR